MVLLEKIEITELVEKFHVFYGTKRFMTVLYRAATWPDPEQLNSVNTLTLHFFKIHLILSSHLRLGLPSGLFPSRLPTKILYVFLLTECTLINVPYFPKIYYDTEFQDSIDTKPPCQIYFTRSHDRHDCLIGVTVLVSI
jgi:hypothetical protein